MKYRETTVKYENAEVCRVYLEHYTEHLFHDISLKVAVFWWNVKGSCRESEFHEIDKKCAKECYFFHIFLMKYLDVISL